MPVTITPISGPSRLITNVDDGNFIICGDASEGRTGCWAIQIEPDVNWVNGGGQLVLMGRIFLKQATDDNAALHQLPYKQIYLNGSPCLRELVNTAITGPSMIEVPANGWTVGFIVSCPLVGTARIYTQPIDGPAMP